MFSKCAMQTRKMYFCKSRCLLAQYWTMKNKRKNSWWHLVLSSCSPQKHLGNDESQERTKLFQVCQHIFIRIVYIHSLSLNEMDIHLKIPCFVLSKLQIFLKMHYFDKIKEGQVETYQILRIRLSYYPFLTSYGCFSTIHVPFSNFPIHSYQALICICFKLMHALMAKYKDNKSCHISKKIS